MRTDFRALFQARGSNRSIVAPASADWDQVLGRGICWMGLTTSRSVQKPKPTDASVVRETVQALEPAATIVDTHEVRERAPVAVVVEALENGFLDRAVHTLDLRRSTDASQRR